MSDCIDVEPNGKCLNCFKFYSEKLWKRIKARNTMISWRKKRMLRISASYVQQTTKFFPFDFVTYLKKKSNRNVLPMQWILSISNWIFFSNKRKEQEKSGSKATSIESILKWLSALRPNRNSHLQNKK